MSRFQLKIIYHTKKQEDLKLHEKILSIIYEHQDDKIRIIWQRF